MVKPDLIIRTNRRSLSLSITQSGELIIRAPKKLDMDYIMNFVKEKEKWILRKQKEMIEAGEKNKNIITYKSFLVCGKSYKRVEQEGLKKIEFSKSSMIFPKCENQNQVVKHAQKFYIKLIKDILSERVEYFADLMQLNYNKIIIMDNRRRWGVCTSNATLKFNYRLSMLPHKVIDYIIIHELAHILEFNHSAKFYKIIESLMPDYKKQIKTLKTYDYLLNLLR